MDDLEFRRAVFAEPFSEDEKLRQAAEEDVSRQALIDDMQQFDNTISAALQVEVPQHLAERLILRQTQQNHQRARTRGRVHLALAASVVFAIGLSVQTLYPFSSSSDIGTHSLAHVSHGINHLRNANETNSLEQVNFKLARFGGKFNQSMGNVVYSNYCDFDGVTSLHMIVQSPQGRVSVFVTPSDANFDFVKDFSNANFVGKGMTFDKAQVTVVGDKGKPIDGFAKKVEQNLNWEI